MTVGNTKIKESMLNLRPITLNFRLFTTSKRLCFFGKVLNFYSIRFSVLVYYFFLGWTKKVTKRLSNINENYNNRTKKSPDCSGLINSRNSENYFFSFFSISAFKPARMSLLSPSVEAGALFVEDVVSETAFTFFSSSSRKIAV